MKQDNPPEKLTDETRNQLSLLKRELHSEIARAGRFSAEAGMAYNHIGAVHYKAKHYKQALKYFRKALSVYLRLPEPPPYLTAVAYANMGSVLDDMGELDSAKEAFFSAMPLFGEAFGAEEARIGTLCYKVAGIYQKQGDLENMRRWVICAMNTRFEPSLPDDREAFLKLKKQLGIGDYEKKE